MRNGREDRQTRIFVDEREKLGRKIVKKLPCMDTRESKKMV